MELPDDTTHRPSSFAELPTLIHLLRWRARSHPDRNLYTFLADGERESERLTYARLERRARAVGARLRETVEPGDRALLLFPPGLDFIVGFFGCLEAGVVAVPAYPPTSKRTLPRLRSIVRDARPGVVLGTSDVLSQLDGGRAEVPELDGVPRLEVDRISDEISDEAGEPGFEPRAEDVAFLQYTSGSTADPKGVRVTHGNLMHNEAMISRAFGLGEDAVIVGWLPLYHDMGLIGNVLQPLYLGGSCVLMSPVAFLKRPRRWLEAIQEYGGTTSGGPNFAYELCVDRIPPAEREGLDLSTWKLAYNGAEPVRAQTLERFAEAFAPQGFRREAFYPCYGLAEATLFVTGGQPSRLPATETVDGGALERDRMEPVDADHPSARKLVSSGRVWEDQRVAVVDPESGRELPDGRVGEIWIHGPSVAHGYWNRPEKTENDFQAHLADDGEPGDGPFLRTGDLGFMTGGELYVTGRLKDLIILRGRNLYPQDIELTVERSHEAHHPGNGAAFSVDVEGEERLVVVQELERRSIREVRDDPEPVFEAIRQAVAEVHEARIHEVVLIKTVSLPKTSSGKVQRRKCRRQYLDDELAVVARSGDRGVGRDAGETTETESVGTAPGAPTAAVGLWTREMLEELDPDERPGAIKNALRYLAAEVLETSPGDIDASRPLTALGLDSLAAVELQQAAETRLGLSLPLAALLEGANLRELAAREGEGETDAGGLHVEAGEPVSELPLSRGQRALWFLDRLDPEAAAYHIAAAVDLDGELDADALGRALDALGARHPALRTTFHASGGEPIQKIADPSEGSTVDFTVLDGAEWTDEELRHRLGTEAWRPFDLEAGPLLRVTWIRRGESRHALVLSVHHLIADFGSLAVLIPELEALYAQETGGDAAELPALPVTYADYVRRQEDRLAGDRGEVLWEYWRETLRDGPRGALPDLDLPTDRSRPAVQSYAGDTRAARWDVDLTDRLEALARDAGVTPFVLLAAAWATYLSRISGETDFALGSPVAGRDAPELEGLVGYFVNPVVLRTDLSGAPTFAQVLERTRTAVAGALEHRDLPFPRLTERLRPNRDPARSPLFQVMFSFQRPHRAGQDRLSPFALGEDGARMRLGPWDLTSRALPERPAQFDLNLTSAPRETGWGASLSFNTDLFDGATIERWLDALTTLLDAAAADPSRPVAELPLLAGAERRRVLVEWNATATDYPRDRRIHELIEDQVDRTPEEIALVFGEEEWSYRRLDERANRIAHRLMSLGVGPEVSVGVHLERSPDMVATALAVLKAGGRYLPLDPSFPDERLAYMLEDSGAPVVVTGDGADDAVGLDGYAGRVVRLGGRDSDSEDLETEPSERPNRPGSPDGSAYVIYTSGSTGRPKGVEVPHRGVVNFLVSMAREPGLEAADVLVSVTTLSFDIAALELYLPLLLGARVVLADAETAGAGDRLRKLLARSGATVMQATPATWRLLVQTGWEGDPAIKVLSGGEALPRDLARDLSERGSQVWNLYGPTETTIWSSVERVDTADPDAPVLLGRPIANTSVYVVDAAGRPMPVGVPGELWIGGDGVTRGYRRRPALTAERFVPDPFGTTPGARLYRTGDLTRRRADGRLEYLGRLDHQVKLRGYRIELGEIEAALEDRPEVAQAVVTVHEPAAGDQRLAAYVVPTPEHVEATAADLADALRGPLLERLPAYMVPTLWVPLAELPLTPNGKVDRKALPAPVSPKKVEEKDAASAKPSSALERELVEIWREVLQVERVGLDDNFFDLGGHSLLVSQVHARLEARGHDLTVVDLFRHPTVRAQTRFLESDDGDAPSVAEAARVRVAARRRGGDADDRIAVVGRAGRFPGAPHVREMWRRLEAGEELLTTFTDEELREAGVDDDLLNDPAYVKASGYLDDADRFDTAVFGFTPREAELMDPQHRVFLEVAWHALEDAGYDPALFPGKIGVFAGAGMNTYLLSTNLNRDRSTASRYQAFVGNDKDFVPTRASYKLNLRGPSVNVQTACSTSLVAVHLACRSLLDGESDMALAGGVTIRAPLKEGYLWEDGGIPSPDGHCRAFDAKAQGTVFGSGAGLVVLKRLQDAVADGDAVHAVVRGTAINNDGSGKIGYTAPSVEGQAEVIATALARADVDPRTVSYVEAHGTGTSLGDPIEVEALTEAFGRDDDGPWCALGSVKTNLGHLDTAAGVAGLIKTVEALEHRVLPPSLHFEEPNPKIDFAAGPFFVNAERRVWEPVNGAPLRAGISSFGIGGTNAHVVLEEAPELEPSGPSRPHQLLLLSAATPSALDAAATNLAADLESHSDPSDRYLADVAHTLRVGRQALEHRRAVVADSVEDAVEALTDPERLRTGRAESMERPVAFLFSGQGSQHPGMARELYETEEVFRTEIDRCAEILKPLWGRDLRELLWPAEGVNGEETAAEELTRTENAQPALFAVEWALAELWESWGVAPTALLGHSIGEYVAAARAGVFSLEAVLALVVERGRLMASMPEGDMLSVRLSEREIQEILQDLGASADDVSLAAVNGPEAVVVSGPAEAVDRVEEALTARGAEPRRLHTSHAFHSGMMEPILEPFAEAVRRANPQAPSRPFVSNVTGTWITAERATDPSYWASHLRSAVRFADGVGTLLESDEDLVLVEVGPGRSLADLARLSFAARSDGRDRLAVPSLPHPREPRPAASFLLDALGRLWTAGVAVDRKALSRGETRRRVPLPGYPFEGERYWLEPRPAAAVAETEPARKLPRDWFSTPLWKEAPARPPLPAASEDGRPWLVALDEGGLGEALVGRLRREGYGVTVLEAERAADGEAWRETLEALKKDDALPGRIVLAGGLDSLEADTPEERTREARERAFEPWRRAVRELERTAPGHPVAWTALATGLHRVAGRGRIEPEKALVAGLVTSVALEHPTWTCRAVDVTPPEDEALETWVDDVLAEIALPPDADEVALRDGARWLRELGPVPMESPEASRGARLREGGVYLITGGLGGLGLTLAKDLARTLRPRLALLGRTTLPDRDAWDDVLDGSGSGDGTARKIRAIRELEELGAEVLPLAADVADRDAMAAALERIDERFGPLHGVIHAAGVPGGGILQLKDDEAVDAVLSPKVTGTLVLDDLLRGRDLDFLALCSSITAVAGGFGQVDYAAANAFLDAYARSRTRRRARDRKGPWVVSLGWDRWEEVGMAAESALPLGLGGAVGGTPVDHPLLDRRVAQTATREVYSGRLDADRHWVLSEHLIAGHPTLPGTTYLEMARAAFADRAAGRAVEIRDVAFLTPLAVAPGDSREVLTVLEAGAEAAEEEADAVWTFRVLSRTGGGESFTLHARGEIRALDERPDAEPRTDFETALGPDAREITVEDVDAQRGEFLVTGARWNSLRRMTVGDDEAVVRLELTEEAAGDVEAGYGLHPALLDIAAGSIQFLADGNYLPLSYERLTALGPIPEKAVGVLSLRSDGEGEGDGDEVRETLTTDVTVYAEDGTPRVLVHGFSMRRITEEAAARLQAGEGVEAPVASASDAPNADPAGAAGDGIRPAEGAEAFRRVLSHGRLSHVVISPRDVHAVIRETRALDRDAVAERLAGLDAPVETHERPESAGEYAPPTNELEGRIAGIWQKVLGLDRVGVHDNFFDLGGTSLSGVQLVSELKRDLGREIPTVSIFEAPTVASLSKYLQQDDDADAFEETRDRAAKKRAALDSRKQALRRRRGGRGRGRKR